MKKYGKDVLRTSGPAGAAGPMSEKKVIAPIPAALREQIKGCFTFSWKPAPHIDCDGEKLDEILYEIIKEHPVRSKRTNAEIIETTNDIIDLIVRMKENRITKDEYRTKVIKEMRRLLD